MIYALFYNGAYLTNETQNAAAFLKLSSKYILRRHINGTLL